MLRSPLMINVTFPIRPVSILTVVQNIAEANPALAVKTSQPQLLERQIVVRTSRHRDTRQQQRERDPALRSRLTHDILAAEIILARRQHLHQKGGVVVA